ncbi:MAG: glycosyltransferase family 1 protein, partial [Bacteroidetes bacterium]
NVTPVVVGPQARHPFLYFLWFELSIPRILRKYKADVFLSPDGYLSLKTNVPSISVIHDLNFEYYPKDMSFIDLLYYKKMFPLFAKKAKRIITVSEYSKSDINKLYGISNSKIDVAYNGINEVYSPISSKEKEVVRTEISNGNKYFVFVGALNPRKNLVGLFTAFDIYKQNTKSKTKLVIVGNKMRWTKTIQETYEQMKLKAEVVFLGHLSPERLNQVVASSIAMVYVSYFEGFGIPIIEAFKAETAVITSNVTSMPEVAADAAFIVDPFNYNEIAAAMHQLEEDESLRTSLIEKGKRRAKDFSWDNTAKVIWESIRIVTK